MCFTTLKRACSVPRIPAGRELFCEFTHLGLSSPVAMQSLDLFAKCAYPSHTFSFVCGLVRAVVLLSHVFVAGFYCITTVFVARHPPSPGGGWAVAIPSVCPDAPRRRRGKGQWRVTPWAVHGRSGASAHLREHRGPLSMVSHGFSLSTYSLQRPGVASAQLSSS